MGKNITWISSYPKSGRTWLKILLESILLYDGEEVALENLKLATATNLKRNDFDRYFGLRTSDLSLEETWEYKRKYYLDLGRIKKKPCYVLTHDENIKLSSGPNMFPVEVTKAVVHIVRNPLSIVASLANHLQVSTEESIRILNAPSISIGTEVFPATTNVYSKTGSWSSHVNSWLTNSNYPVHVIRYEDLLENTFLTILNLLDFLGENVSEEIVKKAIKNTRFEKLSTIEKVEGFMEKPSTSSQFFRKGKVDAWKEELTPKQINRVIGDHQVMMEKMGYIL